MASHELIPFKFSSSDEKLIPIYIRYGDQFICKIMIDPDLISVYYEDHTRNDDLYDAIVNPNHITHEEKCKHPAIINGTYCFKEYINIDNYAPTYYDINMKEISIYQIKKYTSVHHECDYECGIIFYKNFEVVRDKILYNIYFNYRNKSVFVKPIETASGVINLYDEYGNLEDTFFHIDGKINGPRMIYSGFVSSSNPRFITTTNYIDGKKNGKYSEFSKYDINDIGLDEKILYDNGEYITNGMYKNDMREGEFITTYNGKINKIIIYENDKTKSVKRFYKNGNLYVENTFNNDNLVYHNSYYESGNIYLKIIKNDECFHAIHYYDNGNIAWKSSFKKSMYTNKIHEIYDENNKPITIDEFNKKYFEKQLRPRRIFENLRFCFDSDEFCVLYRPFHYIDNQFL